MLDVAEHRVEEHARQRGADQLDDDVARDALPGEVPAQRERERDRRVQMAPETAPMKRMIARTISPGATTAAGRPI